MLNSYYRALCYSIERSSPLNDLNESARFLFNREAEPVFFPHISLLYSSASTIVKEAAFSQLHLQARSKISLTRMSLMKTQGDVQDWKLIEEVELK